MKIKVVEAFKEEVRIERDILGTLLAAECEEGKAVSIDKALEYPLVQVCPSLSTCDGKKTVKSNLFAALADMDEVNSDEGNQHCNTYMINLAA